MPKIENYNCDGLCCQSHCNKKYTHFLNIKIKNMSLHLDFCEDHYWEFYDEIEFLKELKKELEEKEE